MFIKAYTNSEWTIDEVQFALALAVDNLSKDPQDAKLVLSYNSSNYITSPSKDLSKVDYSRSINSNWEVKRDELEFNLKELGNSANGRGFVREYISHVYNNKVYFLDPNHVDGIIATLGESYLNVGLKEVIPTISEDTLYSETMTILYKYPRYQLLFRFMDSKLFKMEFTNYLNSTFGKDLFNNRNEYDPATVNVIINEVKAGVKSTSGNEPYSFSGNNPTAFINNYYKNMFSRTYQYRAVVEALNSRGLYSDATKDSQRIDYIPMNSEELDESSYSSVEETINFKDITMKIYSASRVIFMHNNIMFEDIFTAYREERIKNKFNEINKILGNITGLSLKFSKNTEAFIAGDTDTIKSKYAGRSKIGDILFTKIVTGGLRREEIFDLYQSCSVATEHISSKNGARIFQSRDSVKNSQETTDSDKMRILVNGFIALAKLIHFLDSPGNKTGITVETLPNAIFKDVALCKLYTSITEYVNTIDVTLGIRKEELPEDSDSSEVFDNEKVFDIVYTQGLVEKETKKRTSIISKLWDIDLKRFVSLYNKKADDVNMNVQVLELYSQVKVSLKDDFIIGSIRYYDKERDKDFSFFYFLKYYYKLVTEGVGMFSNIDKINFLQAYIDFFSILGVPLLSEDGNTIEIRPDISLEEYLKSEEVASSKTITSHIIDVTHAHIPKGPTYPLSIVFYSSNLAKLDRSSLLSDNIIKNSTNALIKLFDLEEETGSTVDKIICIITSTDSIHKFIDKFNSMLEAASSYASVSEMYLFYALMAKEFHKFSIPTEIKSNSDLQIFSRLCTVSTAKNVPYGSPGSISKRRLRSTLTAKVLKNYLEKSSYIFRLLDYIDLGIRTELNTYDEYYSYDPAVEERFWDAMNTIRDKIARGDVSAYDLGSKIDEYNLDIDYCEFICIRGSRVRNGNTYYHVKGFCVEIKNLGEDKVLRANIREMEKADISFLLQKQRGAIE